VVMAICHCTDCQHEGGSYSDSAVFPPNSLKYTSGETTKFHKPADSGKDVEHNFCGRCGSTLIINQESLVSSCSVSVNDGRKALLSSVLDPFLDRGTLGQTGLSLVLNFGVRAGKSG